MVPYHHKDKNKVEAVQRRGNKTSHRQDTGYPHDGRTVKDSYPHNCRADNAPYRHDRRADKNPYRHDRNMRFSSKLNYALLSILMVSFFLKLCFIAVGSKHIFILQK